MNQRFGTVYCMKLELISFVEGAVLIRLYQ